MQNQISRPALGQIATLGTFYDARRDCFLSGSLFDADAPVGSVSQTPSKSVDIQLCHEESYASKCNAMNVGSDLAASLLSGVLHPQSLGQHLVAKNENKRRLQASIYHTITKRRDKLDLASPAVKAHITTSTLRTSEVTHVVVEVQYGAQSVITLNHWLRLDDNQEHGKALFKQRVDAFMESIRKPGSKAPGQSDEDFDQITTYSTTLGDEDLVLNDNVETRAFFKLIPIQIRIENGGDGNPIMYGLLPIQDLTYLKLALVKIDSVQYAPDPECMKKFIDLCDEFPTSRRLLEDYEVFAFKHNYCLPRNHLEDVANRLHKLRAAEREMRAEFVQLLLQVRHGAMNPEELSRLLNDAQEGSDSPKSLSTFPEDYQGKVAFVDAMTSKGAVYVGTNKIDLRIQLGERGNIDTYIFFFSAAARQVEDSWKSNVSIMTTLLDNRSARSFFAIVDCDLDPSGFVLERAAISHYQNGRLVVGDILAEQQLLAQQCFARCQPHSLEMRDFQKPLERRFVKIPCPGLNCGGANMCEWKCLACHAPLEYGYSDQFIYCDCGRSLYTNFAFRCNEEAHGPDFESYDNARLLAFLQSLEQSDYLNILILGETGVGKSTFINAFVNYLYFNTLDEALNSDELNWVIPCSFAIQHMDRSHVESEIVETKISVGARDDERDGSKGASATQRTQVYPITVGGITYRLIDTPGIGDTRGLDFDKSNMADILTTVSSYNELHGILILLKSNNARLTAHFSFCVKELLLHLHRDATENVVFGFTNTRISNYMPGDTFGSLKSLLEERRDIGLTLSTKVAYCYDSESFRFLAAAKNGVILDNKPEFESSWSKSRTEADRMLNYFRTRKPHPIKNTISLNATRNLVTELTKPMAEISQLIRTNIALTQDDIRMIASDRLTRDQLLTKLHPEKQLLRTTPLEKPRTVCRDPSCTEYKDDGAGNMLADYPNPCHPMCHLKGVNVDVQAHPQLISCAAFRGSEDCRQCDHHWTMHLHVLYELEPYITKVKDTGIEEQIKKHASEMELKRSAILAREKLMVEYQTEHKEIREAAAKFGLWMKANSILPYNDATLAYLEVLINDEQAKADAGGAGNKKKVQQLREDVWKHEELVGILKESMRQTGRAAPITENEIQVMVKQLFKLKHFGKNLEHLRLEITEVHERTNRELPHRVKKNVATRSVGFPGLLNTTYTVQKQSQQYQQQQQQYQRQQQHQHQLAQQHQHQLAQQHQQQLAQQQQQQQQQQQEHHHIYNPHHHHQQQHQQYQPSHSSSSSVSHLSHPPTNQPQQWPAPGPSITTATSLSSMRTQPLPQSQSQPQYPQGQPTLRPMMSGALLHDNNGSYTGPVGSPAGISSVSPASPESRGKAKGKVNVKKRSSIFAIFK